MNNTKNFKDLGVKSILLPSISSAGYKLPTPVQEKSIPCLISGRDLLVQAPTGTGKTDAFALPILSMLDSNSNTTQSLIIVPTRELAIQVSESFKKYTKSLKKVYITPIYGGQSYQVQIKALKKGTQVIVGTPGRLIDLLRKKEINVNYLKSVVLDEADEMLNMGFIKDIKWILNNISHEYQTALFSATMPTEIKNIAKKYLINPKKIFVERNKESLNNIEQYYISIGNKEKLQALTNFFASEDIQAAVVFVRTKHATLKVSKMLQNYGYRVGAINGDIKQTLRKKIVDRIKNGYLDIVVATDVVARGIDIERISHVVNFDLPGEHENYTHRIGRTGRAGRKGKAVSFVTSKEKRLFNNIKQASHSPIQKYKMKPVKKETDINLQKLSRNISKAMKSGSVLNSYYQQVNNISQFNNLTLEDISAAMAYLMQNSDNNMHTS